MTSLTVAPLQSFTVGSTIKLNGRTFTVTSLAEDPTSLGAIHIIAGTRGAEYMLQAYAPRRDAEDPYQLLFYVSPFTGAGEPLRGKNGKRLQAYIFGDLLTDAS